MLTTDMHKKSDEKAEAQPQAQIKKLIAELAEFRLRSEDVHWACIIMDHATGIRNVENEHELAYFLKVGGKPIGFATFDVNGAILSAEVLSDLKGDPEIQSAVEEYVEKSKAVYQRRLAHAAKSPPPSQPIKTRRQQA
jgi:hypothetical protein